MPNQAEKKGMSQTLEKVKARINMEEELSGEEDVRLVVQGDLSEFERVTYTRPPGVSALEAWGKVKLTDGKHRAQSRASLRAGPRLRVVDRSPQTQGTLGAKLPELCQGQTPKVGENPSGREDRANEGEAGADGQVRREQGQAKERRQGRLGVPARHNPGQRASQEAGRQVRQQPGHEDRHRPRGAGASESAPAVRVFNLQQIEEQARRQSKQRPIDDFSEEET